MSVESIVMWVVFAVVYLSAGFALGTCHLRDRVTNHAEWFSTVDVARMMFFFTFLWPLVLFLVVCLWVFDFFVVYINYGPKKNRNKA